MSEYELPLDEEWELDRSLITVLDTLGEGAFGRVMKADAISLKGMPFHCHVAVKMLKGMTQLFISLLLLSSLLLLLTSSLTFWYQSYLTYQRCFWFSK